MLSRYRLVDHATQGYLLLVAIAALVLRGEHWLALVAAHLVAVLAVHGLITGSGQRKPSEGGAPSPPLTKHSADGAAPSESTQPGRWLLWLREFYPILLYAGLYSEIALINRMLATQRIDPWLLRADHSLFGCQPAEIFPSAAAQPLFREFMLLSYLSYYAMVGGVALWLLLRNLAAFRHFVTVVSLVFYACYTIYLFVPAVGPRVLYADTPERAAFVALYGRAPKPAPESAERGPFGRAFGLIEEHAEIPAAAFPSSHVAVALVTAWFSWRYVRRVRWIHGFFALSILVSTVYTQAHYTVDVIGGLIATAVFFPLAQLLYRRIDGARQTERS